jgi:hypothetical protein
MTIAHLELMSRNRPGPHAEQVGIRYSVIDAAVAEAKRKIEEALNRPCSNCGAHDYAFEIDTKRTDARPYEIMAEAAIERMRGEA